MKKYRPKIRKEFRTWVFYIVCQDDEAPYDPSPCRFVWWCKSWAEAISLLAPNRRPCDTVQCYAGE